MTGSIRRRKSSAPIIRFSKQPLSLGLSQPQHSKDEEDRQMLARVYGRFTEGFDSADLQEAKALLEELSCP
jgi:hypothetical protein